MYFGDQYWFSHLTEKQLIQLYKVMLSYYKSTKDQDFSKVFTMHLFNLEDYIFRQVSLTNNAYEPILKVDLNFNFLHSFISEGGGYARISRT